VTIKRCTLVFLVQGDKILLAMKKRGLGHGLWNGAGGKLEPGETIEQAMIRECQEEIGVTPLEYHKVAELDFLMDSDSEEPWRFDGQVFVATAWQGEPIETEEMAPKWFKLADIPYDHMWEDDILWLPKVLAGKRIKASFSFDSQQTMHDENVTEVETF
jgi:8-oxo-dGTP diphosphatase